MNINTARATNVVSATTRFLRHGTGHCDPVVDYLDKASALLKEGYRCLAGGDLEGALEAGYQAVLRTAGARVAATSTDRKRRPIAGSVWDKLRKIDAAGIAQAEQFERFARTRSRLVMGVPVLISGGLVKELLIAAEGFIQWVNEETGLLPVAA